MTYPNLPGRPRKAIAVDNKQRVLKEESMKPVVFIHTNDKQMVGAVIAEYALKRNSPNRDRFEVRTLHTRDYPILDQHDGDVYLRSGQKLVWRSNNLQSFTPLRFLPPQMMGYQGRAVVMDPDIFAIGDIYELLTRDMGGKAILCRQMEHSGERLPVCATSVMLLECSRLAHWKWEQQIEDLFRLKRDYQDWVNLKYEPEGSIGLLEEEWNHLDTLNERTKMLHTTERSTQPWKTGLPVDYQMEHTRKWGVIPSPWIHRIRAIMKGQGAHPYGIYQPHPDPNQERLFFRLMRECLDQGILAEEFVRAEIRKKHLRPDAMTVVRSLDAA